jgi:hypothetical protein
MELAAESKSEQQDIVHNIEYIQQLIRKYLRVRSEMERLLSEDEQQQQLGEDNGDKQISLGDIILPAGSNNNNGGLYEKSKRGYYVSNGETYDRVIKGKRVNKNMFSSGLQGVWGVPGK